ncbi:MAG: hypothetical protein ACI9FJ_001305 [Alteromonadaceae bacterium]|jgi:hypothetical protein
MATELKRQTLNTDKTVKPKGQRVIKKTLQVLICLVFISFIIAPKPQLIVYKKLNLVAQSIYLPGWFGTDGKFLDSSQRVIINKSLGVIYLCYAKGECNRYQFIEQKGLFAALDHYRHNNQ